jgi:hypothetical protein
MVYFSIAGKDFHIVKLAGAFIIFGAVLMVLNAAATMIDSWSTVKNYRSCVEEAKYNLSVPELVKAQYKKDQASGKTIREETNEIYVSPLGATVGHLKLMDCKDTLYKKTGIKLGPNEDELTARQFFAALLAPIAKLFFWLAVVLFGFVFYNAGRLAPTKQEEKKHKKSKH